MLAHRNPLWIPPAPRLWGNLCPSGSLPPKNLEYFTSELYPFRFRENLEKQPRLRLFLGSAWSISKVIRAPSPRQGEIPREEDFWQPHFTVSTLYLLKSNIAMNYMHSIKSNKQLCKQPLKESDHAAVIFHTTNKPGSLQSSYNEQSLNIKIKIEYTCI